MYVLTDGNSFIEYSSIPKNIVISGNTISNFDSLSDKERATYGFIQVNIDQDLKPHEFILKKNYSLEGETVIVTVDKGEIPLEQWRDIKIEALREKRDNKLKISSFIYNNDEYEFSKSSMENVSQQIVLLMFLASQGQELPAEIYWLKNNGDPIVFSVPQFYEFALTQATYKQSIFTTYTIKLMTLKALSTHDEITEFDIAL